MEESKSLARLGEAADLLILLEDILNPSSIERLSPSAWSGLRLTLKNARSMLQESQTSLSKDFVARARNGVVQVSQAIKEIPVQEQDQSIPLSADSAKALITRRDLKASLEKFIESRV
jgi:hypothetical protein